MPACGCIIAVTIVCCIGIVAAGTCAGPNPVISDDCIGCICHASTQCNMSVGCVWDTFCGPLLISRPYWKDAGKCILTGADPNTDAAFKDCTNDAFCAAEIVRAYMEKFSQDCNGDNKIDCEDFARIHKSGGYNCARKIGETDYYAKFQFCKTQLGGSL